MPKAVPSGEQSQKKFQAMSPWFNSLNYTKPLTQPVVKDKNIIGYENLKHNLQPISNIRKISYQQL